MPRIQSENSKKTKIPVALFARRGRREAREEETAGWREDWQEPKETGGGGEAPNALQDEPKRNAPGSQFPGPTFRHNSRLAQYVPSGRPAKAAISRVITHGRKSGIERNAFLDERDIELEKILRRKADVGLPGSDNLGSPGGLGRKNGQRCYCVVRAMRGS